MGHLQPLSPGVVDEFIVLKYHSRYILTMAETKKSHGNKKYYHVLTSSPKSLEGKGFEQTTSCTRVVSDGIRHYKIINGVRHWLSYPPSNYKK